MSGQRVYSSDQIIRRVGGGLTYRKLDHWTHQGLIAPSIADTRGSGSRRLWSESDLRMIRLIVWLTDVCAMSPGKLREVVCPGTPAPPRR